MEGGGVPGTREPSLATPLGVNLRWVNVSSKGSRGLPVLYA